MTYLIFSLVISPYFNAFSITPSKYQPLPFKGKLLDVFMKYNPVSMPVVESYLLTSSLGSNIDHPNESQLLKIFVYCLFYRKLLDYPLGCQNSNSNHS